MWIWTHCRVCWWQNCVSWLISIWRTKNITISASFRLVFFTISVYQKLNCLCTFALIALMPQWHNCGASVVLFQLWPWHVITTLITKLILDSRMRSRNGSIKLNWQGSLLPSVIGFDCYAIKSLKKPFVRYKCISRILSAPYRSDFLLTAVCPYMMV